MKKEQVNELIRLIVKKVLKEYMSAPSDVKDTTSQDQPDATDPNMTAGEKAKLEREKRHEKQIKLQQTKLELDAEKKQQDFYKKKQEQSRRYNIPRLNKDVQTLSGAKI